MGKRRKRKMAEEKPLEQPPVEAPTIPERLPEEERLPSEEKPAARGEAPSKRKAPAKPPVEVKVTEEEQVYEYLAKHGATKALRIAKDLNLSLSAVAKALGALNRQGKIHFR